MDQVPEPDGKTRVRILSRIRPHADAASEPPSLEDGYLVLTG